MRRKMALLLAFVMVVTTFVSVPFVSYAADKTIPAITAVEQIVEATPTIASEEKLYTATYKYTSGWNSKVQLYADNIEGAVKTITVNDSATGTVLPEDESATDTYTLVKGTTYTIKLKYVFEVAPETGLTELSLKTKAVSSILTPGTPISVKSTDNIIDQELWYAVNVNSKGVIFSLDTIEGTAKDVGYSAYIYDETVLRGNKTPLGVSSWDAGCEMMFECPLVLAAGTYYIKVCPKKGSGNVANFKLSATADTAKEIDISPVDPPTSLTVGGNYSLDLYSYLDKESGDYFAYWYKIAPTTTGKYELSFDFEDSVYGDLGVGLIDLNRDFRDLVPDGYAYVGNNNTFYVDLVAGNTYSLRLMPMSDTPKTHCVVSVKNHNHEDRWFTSEDNDTVVYGCPCDEENYSFVGKLNRKKITVPSQVYNGVQAVTVVPKFVYSETEGTERNIDPACYTLTYYNSKGVVISADKVKNIGKYSVDINFCSATNSKDSLAGIKKISKLTFKVVPEGTTLADVTPGKKSLKVKWNRRIVRTDGYQIQYSTNSKFGSAKTVTVSKNSTASKKISNLKAKKTYYVRVRTYRTVSKTKYYSAWSEAMKAKTK